MKYSIGQSVRYIPGYRGYFAATVVEYAYGTAFRYVIEFSSGLQISAHEDDMEAI